MGGDALFIGPVIERGGVATGDIKVGAVVTTYGQGVDQGVMRYRRMDFQRQHRP